MSKLTSRRGLVPGLCSINITQPLAPRRLSGLEVQKSIRNFLQTRAHFNPYSLNVTFLYPLKTSEKLWLSDIFRRYRNVTLGEYGLKWEQFTVANNIVFSSSRVFSSY